MAVKTKIWFPQTTGLECPNPGMGDFQRMFSPFSAFQLTAVSAPSATPQAFCPRKLGQLIVLAGLSLVSAVTGRWLLRAAKIKMESMVGSGELIRLFWHSTDSLNTKKRRREETGIHA